MKKETLIGAGAIAAATVIMAGFYFSNEKSNQFDIPPSEEESKEETQQKIDDLYFDQLKYNDNYSFCYGTEKINGTTKDYMLETESNWTYTATELNLVNKESDKMQIIARTIDYKHDGNIVYVTNIGDGFVDISKKGRITEYYRNSGPIRVDYYSNTIFSSPDTTSDDWVDIINKMRGTVLGVTMTDAEYEKGRAETFCSAFSISEEVQNEPTKNNKNNISLFRKCEDMKINPGEFYNITFDYICEPVTADEAIKMIKNYQEEIELQKNKEEEAQEVDPIDEILREDVDSGEEDIPDGSASVNESKPSVDNDFTNILSDPESDEKPNQESIKKQLEELRNEIRADQSER